MQARTDRMARGGVAACENVALLSTETGLMRLPPALIALDVFGTLVLALGIYAMVAENARLGGIELGPLALPMIIIGAFLMAPLIIYIVTRIASRPRR